MRLSVVRDIVKKDSVEELNCYFDGLCSIVFSEVCEHGSRGLYDAMIKRGCVPDKSCLRASIGNDLFYELIKIVTPSIYTLERAIVRRDSEGVKMIIETGVDVNAMGLHGMSMLELSKEPEITLMLQSVGAQ